MSDQNVSKNENLVNSPNNTEIKKTQTFGAKMPRLSKVSLDNNALFQPNSEKRRNFLNEALASSLEVEDATGNAGVHVNNFWSSKSSMSAVSNTAADAQPTPQDTNPNLGVVSQSENSNVSEPQENDTPAPAEGKQNDLDYFADHEILNGRYRVDEIIGEGGFGIVYKAIDTQTKNIIAIKTLRRTIPNYELAKKRFQREIELTTKLCNPHTIKVTDHGTSAKGVMFFCMELLEGDTLDDRLEDGKRFTFTEMDDIIRQVLGSMAEAHSYGIIHRDMKPSNIFLKKTPDKSYDVRVLDFGIAKITNELDQNNKLTQTGASFGSPAYMSPEQVKGEKELTTASDIYAVGLIMIEMLTACPVVQGNTAFDTALQQLSPNPVEIPLWIKDSCYGPIITKAVERQAENRYANGEEMLEAIKKLSRSDLLEDYHRAQRNHFPSVSASQSVASASSAGQTPQAASSESSQTITSETMIATQAPNSLMPKILLGAILLVVAVIIVVVTLVITQKNNDNPTPILDDTPAQTSQISPATRRGGIPPEEVTLRKAVNSFFFGALRGQNGNPAYVEKNRNILLYITAPVETQVLFNTNVLTTIPANQSAELFFYQSDRPITLTFKPSGYAEYTQKWIPNSTSGINHTVILNQLPQKPKRNTKRTNNTPSTPNDNYFVE